MTRDFSVLKFNKIKVISMINDSMAYSPFSFDYGLLVYRSNAVLANPSGKFRILTTRKFIPYTSART